MGSGKTLTFWMPLLFFKEGIQIVITALNGLAKQNVRELEGKGIGAIALTGANANAQNFQIKEQDIEDGIYHVIVTNIETINKVCVGFDQLYKAKHFTDRVISMVWDEGHCVSSWGDFRLEYKDTDRLRFIIPQHISFYLTSTTMPTRDLAFVIPPNCSLSNLPPKFIIFFDNITESIAAAKFLWSLLSLELCFLIKWFNLDISPEFWEDEVSAFQADKQRAGLRFGRAARDLSLDAIAILFVKPSRTDAKKVERDAWLQKQAEKRKADADLKGHARKRHASDTAQRSRVESNGEDQNPATECLTAVAAKTTGSQGLQALAERYEERGQEQPKKSTAGEVEPVMDDLINAATREEILCIQKPATAMFGNKETAQDMSLRAALHSFCKRKTIEKYRKACLRNTGPAIIMSDNILDRIVDCAHAYVISTLDQLAKETYWGCVEELGEEVLQMILNMCPKPTPHINPLGPIHT
ncbi:hypothetical protein HWV62_25022 [Athelia sp. TMB]|nr:hypothetical protein HWV62_25022 [Athelia sp. TMB]